MTTISFQVGAGQPVLIDFENPAPLSLAEQIEAALASDSNAQTDTQVLTTGGTFASSDPFVLIPATGAATVSGSGSQSIAGGSGGLTYTNDSSGSTVSVALNGGNNNLTFGSGVRASVATGAGNDTVTASGSGSFDVGAGTNTVNLSGDNNSNDTATVTAAGSLDTITLGAATATVNESGSDALITAGTGAVTLNLSGSDTFDGGNGGSTQIVNGAAGADITLENSANAYFVPEVVLGAGADTVNAADAAGGVYIFADSGNDSITGGSGYQYFSLEGGQNVVTMGGGPGVVHDYAVAGGSDDIINDLGAGDSVDIAGASSVQTILADGVVQNGSLTLTLAAGNTITFVGVTSLTGHILDPSQGPIPVCYAAGTRLLTDRGEIAIENLAVGDTVVTASGAHRPVRWLGARRVDCARHPEPAAVWPVRIQAGAFADGLPARDLWVSPGHSIFADGVLIQAQNLVNGATITQVPLTSVEYWHLELDAHDIVLAEGLPAESYLDTGNRAAFFQNGGAYLEAHPDFKPRHWAETCVPLVFEGPALQLVKAQLLARAHALGHSLTSDADLHIVAAGMRIEPLFMNEQRVAFVLPPERTAIELRCRSFVPAHIDAVSRDPRKLGVCVRRLQIDGVDLALDDEAAFARGWHELEAPSPQHRQRWSHESAPLPDGARLVVIELAGRSYGWAPSGSATLVSCQGGAA